MSTAKTGTKITTEELSKMDPKLGGDTVLPRPYAEVEGQVPYVGTFCCPWCGAGPLPIEPNTACYKWFTCPACGRTFRF